jgi:hypothetical protein
MGITALFFAKQVLRDGFQNRNGEGEKINKGGYGAETPKDKGQDKGEGDKKALSFVPPTSCIGASKTIMQSISF